MISLAQKVRNASELLFFGAKAAVIFLGYLCLVAGMSFMFVAIPIGAVLGLIFQNETFIKSVMVLCVAVAVLIAIGHTIKEELDLD